jgi:hypothetical protein
MPWAASRVAALAPHAKGVDIALAAFGVGKGSAKMADEEVRKIEIAYPTAFASAARAGGARVLAMMTAAGADAQSSTKYLRNMGDKEKKSEALKFDFLGVYRPGMILGNSNTPSALGFLMPLFHLGDAVSLPLDSQERPGARHGRAVGAGVPRARAGQRPRGSGGEDSRVQGDGAVLRGFIQISRPAQSWVRTFGQSLRHSGHMKPALVKPRNWLIRAA